MFSRQFPVWRRSGRSPGTELNPGLSDLSADFFGARAYLALFCTAGSVQLSRLWVEKGDSGSRLATGQAPFSIFPRTLKTVNSVQLDAVST
jgi:hypothetical protein